METSTILCPKCQTPVNVSDILYQQIQDHLKKDFDKQLLEKDLAYKAKQEEMAAARAQLVKEKESFHEEIENAVRLKLNIEKARLEKSISDRLKDESSQQIQTLQKELDEKSLKVKELNQTKAEIEKLKREKDELRETVSLEKEKEFSETLRTEKHRIQIKADESLKELMQTKTLMEQLKREKEEMRDTVGLEKEREFSEKLRTEKMKIQIQAEESSAFKINELKKQLEDQKKLAEEMRRKAEQGSMQLQGEVQELAIEEWLRMQFPLDTIDEVKKGVNGADCVQIVHTHTRQNCGKICYESKRTKNFGGDWIAKLKEDTFRSGANVGVLVTQVYPREMDRMGLIEGVWVCSFEEFKGLCTVIREGIIQVSTAMATQENKGDKMVMLYDFLTGNEFRSQVEAIVIGFNELQNGLDYEKRSLQRIWAERQKQIDKVIKNTVGMYGSIKGIAGNAIQEIQALELGIKEVE